MYSLREDLEEFRRQLRNGSTQRAYAAPLSYMLGLRRQADGRRALVVCGVRSGRRPPARKQ